MHVLRIGDPGIEEDCPTASLAGYYVPTDRQLATLFARGGDGRLNPSLRDDSLVQWGDAVGTLASAAVFRALETGAATAEVGFGGAGNPDVALALADLSVSGATNLADFRREAGRGSHTDIPALRARIVEALRAVAERMGVTLVPGTDAERRAAVDHVVNRALAVVWALHGPSAYRVARRPDLGWIAVNAERDPPPRPVNVPATAWPMGDLNVTVEHDGREITCRIRYAIAGGHDASSSVDVLGGLPNEHAVPVPPRDGLALVFLHGHSSRLEEGDGLYEALREQHAGSCLREPFCMLAFDFPTNGYAEYLDHEDLSPLASTTRFVPDRPLQRRFGLLEYYERVVVGVVEEFEQRAALAGVPGLRDRIAAVIGGSMGGNLALRLSERLVTDPEWLRGLVAWSPASVYGSFGRADYLFPSPGEHVDPIAKEALERPHDRCREAESEDSRRSFIGLQMQGERLINDGTTEFEVGVRALPFLMLPLVGGLAPLLLGPGLGPLVSGLTGPAVFGSIAVEGVANIITVKQSDEWLRPACRAGYDGAAAARGALLSLQETYNSRRRRMHWRIAYEQLLFSHQDEVAASRGVPCYEASEVPTLLIAGSDDVVDEGRFNIFGGVAYLAPRMVNNPGLAILVSDTGHSIHAERPQWLAREIYRFACRERPRERVVAVRREGGRIVALDFGEPWALMPIREATDRTLAARPSSPFHLVDPGGNRKAIIARRFLTTRPDDRVDNNLRSLPETRLPPPGPRECGPLTGFEVTHIRVAEGREHMPWTSWVTHLCNDGLEYQVPTHLAEDYVRRGGARYTIRTDGEEQPLRLVEFLTTSPDESEANNLAALPESRV